MHKRNGHFKRKMYLPEGIKTCWANSSFPKIITWHQRHPSKNNTLRQTIDPMQWQLLRKGLMSCHKASCHKPSCKSNLKKQNFFRSQSQGIVRKSRQRNSGHLFPFKSKAWSTALGLSSPCCAMKVKHDKIRKNTVRENSSCTRHFRPDSTLKLVNKGSLILFRWD